MPSRVRALGICTQRWAGTRPTAHDQPTAGKSSPLGACTGADTNAYVAGQCHQNICDEFLGQCAERCHHGPLLLSALSSRRASAVGGSARWTCASRERWPKRKDNWRSYASNFFLDYIVIGLTVGKPNAQSERSRANGPPVQDPPRRTIQIPAPGLIRLVLVGGDGHAPRRNH
jgi:hypothetical protein